MKKRVERMGAIAVRQVVNKACTILAGSVFQKQKELFAVFWKGSVACLYTVYDYMYPSPEMSVRGVLTRV